MARAPTLGLVVPLAVSPPGHAGEGSAAGHQEGGGALIWGGFAPVAAAPPPPSNLAKVTIVRNGETKEYSVTRSDAVTSR